jgi:hypothetical protein
MIRILYGPLTELAAGHLAQDLHRAQLDTDPGRPGHGYRDQLCNDITCCQRVAAAYTAEADNAGANHFRWLAEGLRRGIEAAA